jgi:o-succinylbenzoate synthase
VSLRCELSRYRVGVAGARPVSNAQSTWATRAGVVIDLFDDSGARGQGEAAPLPGYSDETLEVAEGELRALEVDALPELGEVVERAVREPAELSDWLFSAQGPSAPSARFALQSAAVDLIARRRGEPVHRLLRALPCCDPFRAKPETLELAALVPLHEAVLEARRQLDAGFRTLKMKVGRAGAFEDEANALRELRRQLGDEFALRVDANGVWTRAEALERCGTFASVDIELIEEPCATAELLEGGFALPLALDESLRRGVTLEPPLKEVGVVAVVLKPSVLGGFDRCLTLAKRARELGFAVIVSHSFEGPIALAASAELCLALGPKAAEVAPTDAGQTSSPPRRLAQGLAPHPALDAWFAPLPCAFRGAHLVPHEEPGLGLPPLSAPGQRAC